MVPNAFSMDWFDLPVRRWLRPLCYLLIVRLENVAESIASDEGRTVGLAFSALGQVCLVVTGLFWT